MKKQIKSMTKAVTNWRRSLHAMAELAFEEKETSAFLHSKLTEIGVDEIHALAGTGVVAVVKGKRQDSGKSVMLRADMDALPIVEQTGASYASKNTGVMHACGHDGHMAMLLGAAKYLTDTRDFNGTVYLVFQPAEEKIGGAREMIKQGLFEQFPADAVYGMHNFPKIPLGMMGSKPGEFFSAIDTFQVTVTSATSVSSSLNAAAATLEITLHGKGGHSAMAAGTSDIAGAASALAAEIAHVYPGRVDVHAINTSSKAFNVLSDSVTVTCTLGDASLETEIKDLAAGIAAAKNVTASATLSPLAQNVTPANAHLGHATASIQQAIASLADKGIADKTAAVCSVSSVFSTGPASAPVTSTLAGTIRTYDPALRETLVRGIETLSTDLAAHHGCTVTVTFGENYPALLNTAAETDTAMSAARAAVGNSCVLDAPRTTTSEDFSFYLQKRPGNFMILGTGKSFPTPLRQLLGKLINKKLKKDGKPSGDTPITRGIADLHTAKYDFNDKALPIGITYWAKLVERVLPVDPAPAPQATTPAAPSSPNRG